MGDVKKLEVWHMSLELATIIYTLTTDSGLSKEYSLKDQMRRAAISVSSNIAEGAGS